MLTKELSLGPATGTLPLNTDHNHSNNNDDYDVIIQKPQAQIESFPEWRSDSPSGRQKGKKRGKGEERTEHPWRPHVQLSFIRFLNPGNTPQSGVCPLDKWVN